jgi:hypothetical protein
VEWRARAIGDQYSACRARRGRCGAALAQAAGFFQPLGKAVSVIDDAPGLVVMRTVAMLANEAADVVHQGVASAVDVDVSMLKGVGYADKKARAIIDFEKMESQEQH